MNASNPSQALVLLSPVVDRSGRTDVRGRASKARQLVGPPPPDRVARTLRAAQYLRMSTDMQDYSPVVQSETIARYATEHNLDVVRTYADEGKSGLTLRERNGLRDLLEHIADGVADYGVVLVYDVSRWGRFQDCDESAHYEYLCRRGGVRVEYCAEPFANDGSPMAAVMKGLKRVMAGEYSRELSARVFRAKCSLARRGFRQGGTAGYGFRRAIVRADGSPNVELQGCEHKFLREDRIVLIAGPEQERETIRWIFEQVADHGQGPKQISDALNTRGVPGPEGKSWNRARVQGLLSNPKYMGELVYNRVSMKLKSRAVRNPAAQWVRVPGAFPVLVDPELFARAQRAIACWPSRISNEDALGRLKALYERVGWLSTKIIEQAEGIPGPHFFESRFGGLNRAYALVGFEPPRDYGFLASYAKRRALAKHFRAQVVHELSERGVEVEWAGHHLLVLDGWLRVSVMLAMGRRTPAGPRWTVQFNGQSPADWVLARRMSADELDVRDHWLYPAVFGTVYLGAKHRTQRERYERASLDTILDVLATKARGCPLKA